jgi:hypothetical protein
VISIERAARNLRRKEKQLECARELLSQSRYEHNEALEMLCEAVDDRRKNG